MVTLFGYLTKSAAEPVSAWLSEHLTPQQTDRLAHVGEAMVNLLAPLAQVRSRAELETLFPSGGQRFFRLKEEMFELLWQASAEPRELKKQIGNLYEQSRRMTAVKSDLFGEEALQAFLGALSSAEGLTEWAFESIQQGGSSAHRLTIFAQQFAEPALHADMTITVIQAVLFDTITDWSPEAIPILCAAADEYMTAVEDVFLGASPVDSSPGETLDYESVRKELAL